MTQCIKLILTERVWREDADGYEYAAGVHEFQIDLSKWDQFVKDNDFAAGYVEDIIVNVLNGATHMQESRKYTFHDMESAYEPLFTTEPDSAFDKVVHAYVNIY